MPFFVAIYQEAWPGHVQQLLATIRGSFTARTLHSGRRNARVFQRLNEPTQLLAITEWEGQAAYERLRESPELGQVADGLRADPNGRVPRTAPPLPPRQPAAGGRRLHDGRGD